jgi:hypothetical protein
MALKPLNSPGGFSVGEISTGAINVISSTGNVTTGNINGSAGGNLNIIADNLLINGGNGVGNLSVGNLIATGNVSGAYILGNGSQLSGMYSNLNVANYLPTYTGSFANLTGNVTTTANIQGQYILGNGYFLTNINAGNIVGSYGNSDVANYLASNAAVTILTTGNITTAANVSGSYLLGNIRSATGGYDDANVAAYTGALTNLTGNVTTTANVQGSYLLGNIRSATGGYDDANVAAYTGALTNLTGNVTTTANVSGAYLLGNGYFISGIQYSNITGAYSNNDVNSYLGSNAAVTILTTGNITTAANISGNYILGNGAFLTSINAGNIVGGYGNANVKAYLESGSMINANFDGGTLYATGIANLGPTTVNGNLVVAGNISATGNITYINVQDLVVDDPLIQLAANNPGDVEDIGIVGGYNDGIAKHTGVVRDYTDGTWKVFANVTSQPNIVINWSQAVYAPFKAGPILSNASITANANVTATGNVSGSYLLGNGYFITDIQYSNITGAYSNTNVLNYLASNAAVTILTTGNITTTANIAGDYFLGNGAFLTGINAGNLVGAYSNANVANYLPTYTGNLDSLAGNVTTTANVSGSFILGNGAFLTGMYSNLNVANYLPTYTGNVGAGNLNLTGNIVDTGALSIITGAAGNISLAPNGTNTFVATTGGANVTGNLDVTGNISAGNFIGTGANTTIAAGSFTYTFDNVGNVTLPVSGNLVGGNTVSANFFLGNGSLLSGMYSNLNVANYLPTYTGNVGAGNLNLTGNIVDTGALQIVTGASGNIGLAPDGTNTAVISTTGVTVTGTLSATGNITSSGNVSGTYLLGNGAFITGLPAGYSNADVANYLASGSLTSNIITTGNISGGNLSGTLTTAAQPNITSVGTLTSLSVTGNITSTSGNISGNYLLGNGAFITGLPAGYSNADVANYLASNAAVTILTTGNITTSGNVTANNFTGTGSNTTIRSNGFSWVFDGTGNLTTPVAGTITGGNLITANFFAGDGSLLTNINAGNILGSYGNANVKAYLESGATINANFGTGTVTTTGNITGGNIGGALVSGTLTTAAQPNITTLGTLVSLDVSANITAGGLQMSTANATIGNLYVTGNTTIAGNITQISGNSGQFFGNAATGFNALYAGLPAGFTLLPQSVMNYVTSFNGYSQVNNQNQNGGDEATVDYVLTGNNGDDETYYFDIGYTSSGFDGAIAGANNAMGTAVETNDAYMYTTANVAAGQIGNLIIATVDTGSQIRFVVGGRNMGNTAFRINSPNTVSANSISGTVTVQGDAGINGNINASANITGGNLVTSGAIIGGTANVTSLDAFSGGTGGSIKVKSGAGLTTVELDGSGFIIANGNIDGANFNTTGNVTGSYLLGNGAFITGLPAGYSNADVTAFLASSPNINITLGNSNSNITTHGIIRTYSTSIANNFVANSTVTIQSSATQAVVFDAINQTTSSASLTTLATIDVTTLPADSSALEVVLRGKDGTNTQAGKIMIVWGGSAMDYSRYAEVLAGAGCGVPSASFDGTNLLIQVTPLNGNTMSWNGSITSV